MEKTPKSLRLQIGLFGRTNVGKSSFLNMVAAQDVAITSPIPGTTTDVVEKTMELLPVGPVVFLDTAGIDDTSAIAKLRIQKTERILDRSDCVLLIVESGIWTEFEDKIFEGAQSRKAPLVVIVNKIDQKYPSEEFLSAIRTRTERIILCTAVDSAKRDDYVNQLKEHLIQMCPDEISQGQSLIGDLLPAGGLAVLIVPIDLEAPKGRLILPQVQTIRDALDHDGGVMVVKEREYTSFLQRLKYPPDLVVCDSQVVLKMVADTPPGIKCTTFSILFSRLKGDLIEMARGAAAVDLLQAGDKVLISEACSHHALEDDIGRVKIPRWLRQYTGLDLKIDVCSGRDYPADLKFYKLIIHCGSCMLTRRETLLRIYEARQAKVPITNYGICISVLQGVVVRVLEPFPSALAAYRQAQNSLKRGVSHDCLDR